MEVMRSLVDSFSLREINYAKTRLNILQVVMERISVKDFNEITVDEICRFAEISRGTFFNHFATKSHIFKYYIKLWGVHLRLEMEEKSFINKTAKEKIKFVYHKIVEENEKYPSLFSSYLKEAIEFDNEIKLTGAEIAYQFPNISHAPSRVEELNEFSLGKVLETLLKEGIEKEEFSKDINLEYTLLLLISMIFSTAIADKYMPKHNDLHDYYEYSLNHIFERMKV